MNSSPIISHKLSEAAQTAKQFINQTQRHVFLTGKAGTGKTTFLKYILQNTHKKAIVVAPTGIAAINAGGSTIHSMFQLPFGAFVPVANFAFQSPFLQITDRSSLFRQHKLSSVKQEIIREIELLIIDEVSMLRADLLDAIDAVMRHVKRRSHLAFGGAQVLFIGDMYQLPPVYKEEELNALSPYYKSLYFFDALVLKNDPPVYIELDKIYRQSNRRFIELLNNLRNNELNQDDADLLNSHYRPGFVQDIKGNYIYLTTHNLKANAINTDFLNRLQGPAFTFEADCTGDFPEHLYPLEKKLILKEGAQVMFVKNDLSGKQAYFNGKMARVKSLSGQHISVEFEDGSTHAVSLYTWENKRFVLNSQTNEIEEEILGEFKQYPLKLAWAITVHKSQGLTFDKAIIDVSGAFAPGQVYVAMSRLRDLDGLVLSSRINFNSLREDEKISAFSEQSGRQGELREQLSAGTLRYLNSYLETCYDFSFLNRELKQFAALIRDHKSKSLKQKFKLWLEEEQGHVQGFDELGKKFIQQLQSIIHRQTDDWARQLGKRVQDAEQYFTPALKTLSSGLLTQATVLREEKRNKLLIAEFSRMEVQVFEQSKKIKKAVVLCENLFHGSDFGREEQDRVLNLQERKKELEHAAVITTNKPKEKTEKKEKTDSKKLSCDLFKTGMGIAEIASTRHLAESTVEGHLAQGITKGYIHLEELLPANAIHDIQEVLLKLENPTLSLARTQLNENYSFSEIRFVLNDLKLKKTLKV